MVTSATTTSNTQNCEDCCFKPPSFRVVCCSVIDNCYTQRDTDTGEVGGGGRLTLGKRERKREAMKTQLRKQSGEMKEMEETASKSLPEFISNALAPRHHRGCGWAQMRS